MQVVPWNFAALAALILLCAAIWSVQKSPNRELISLRQELGGALVGVFRHPVRLLLTITVFVGVSTLSYALQVMSFRSDFNDQYEQLFFALMFVNLVLFPLTITGTIGIWLDAHPRLKMKSWPGRLLQIAWRLLCLLVLGFTSVSLAMALANQTVRRIGIENGLAWTAQFSSIAVLTMPVIMLGFLANFVLSIAAQADSDPPPRLSSPPSRRLIRLAMFVGMGGLTFIVIGLYRIGEIALSAALGPMPINQVYPEAPMESVSTFVISYAWQAVVTALLFAAATNLIASLHFKKKELAQKVDPSVFA